MISIETLYSLFEKNPTITTDSRSCPSGSIFFALKGENFNGNLFATQAIESGCSYAIVDEAIPTDNDRILVVDDCLVTLQKLAAMHRSKMHIPIVGITGTNGKTTTKELMAAIVGKKYRVLFTHGNQNNHIGVPLTLLKIKPEHEFAIIEMGANHPGEIKELVELVDPDYGLITNVGKAHIEGFGSFEGVIRTKGELYDYLRSKGRKVFINTENPYLKGISNGLDCIEYSTKESPKLWGEVYASSPFLEFTWHTGNNKESYKTSTKLIGAYNLENAMAGIAVGLEFGVPPLLIKEALEEYAPSNNRSQWMQTEINNLVIDAYNANPTSMAAALKNFDQFDSKHKAVILGSMKELGSISLEEHKQLIYRLAQLNFERVFLIGSEFKEAGTDYPIFEHTGDLINLLKQQPLKGYDILVKGSRGNRLEDLIPYL